MSNQYPAPESIAAIIPRYSPTGDQTAIITTGGHTTMTDSRIRTVLHHLARSRATDLVSLKQHSSCATQRAILQPLPLAPGLVLFPVKIRIPRIRGDTSTGYINFHAVTSVAEKLTDPYQAIINLIGGSTVPVLWKAATIRKHLQSARLAIAHASRYAGSSVFQESAADYNPEIFPIAQKLVEVICEILILKQRRP